MVGAGAATSHSEQMGAGKGAGVRQKNFILDLRNGSISCYNYYKKGEKDILLVNPQFPKGGAWLRGGSTPCFLSEQKV